MEAAEKKGAERSQATTRAGVPPESAEERKSAAPGSGGRSTGVAEAEDAPHHDQRHRHRHHHQQQPQQPQHQVQSRARSGSSPSSANKSPSAGHRRHAHASRDAASDRTSATSHRSVLINQQELVFDESDLLGKGKFGAVYRGYFGRHVVAVKEITTQLDDKAKRAFRRECAIMKRLKHSNVVRFYGMVEAPDVLLMALELVPKGDLFQLISSSTPGSSQCGHWLFCSSIARDVARGMAYLHSLNPIVVHRDLKSQNVLLGDRWNAKITDFGLSRMMGSHEHANTFCGSPAWAAPEILRSEAYTHSVDVYSFGVILCELVNWTQPYPNVVKGAEMQTLSLIARGMLSPVVDGPHWEVDLREVAVKCMAFNSRDRPEFSAVSKRMAQLVHKYHKHLDDEKQRAVAAATGAVAGAGASGGV